MNIFLRMSLFSRILISFILIALLAVLLFTVFFVPRLLNATTRALETQYRDSITQTRENLDGTFEFVKSLKYAFENNTRLRPYGIGAGDAIQCMEAANEIVRYTSLNLDVFDIFVYINDKQLLVSGYMGKTSVEEFGETIYDYERATKRELLSALSEITPKQTLYIPNQQVSTSQVRQYALTTIIMPLSAGAQRAYGSILVMLNSQRLIDALKSGWSNSTVCIIDESGIPLISTGELSGDQLNTLTALPSGGAALERVSGDRLTYCESEILGLRYAAFTDEKSAMYELRLVKQTIIIAFSVAVIVLSLLLTLLIRWDYMPVKRMLMIATDDIYQRNLWKSNETKIISRAFKELRDINEQMSSAMLGYQSGARDSMLHRLVTGQYDQIDALLEKCASVGIPLKGEYYCVADARFSRAIPMERIQLLLCDPEWKENGIALYPTTGAYRESVILVIQTQTDDPSFLSGMLNKLVELTYQTEETQTTIFAGPIVREAAQLNRSYMAASRALEKESAKKLTRGVILYDNLSEHDGDPESEMLFALEDAVLQKDSARITNSVTAIINYLRDGGSISQCCYIAYMAMRILMNTERDFVNAELVNPFVSKWMDSAEGMANMLKTACDSVVSEYANINPMRRNEQVENILIYIDEHLLDQRLDCRSAAEEFGMSTSTFSHYFKRNMHVTFSDYIRVKRMYAALCMLTTTDMCVEDIAQMIGYSNASNFIRMFKSVTGMTPSQARQDGARKK